LLLEGLVRAAELNELQLHRPAFGLHLLLESREDVLRHPLDDLPVDAALDRAGNDGHLLGQDAAAQREGQHQREQDCHPATVHSPPTSFLALLFSRLLSPCALRSSSTCGPFVHSPAAAVPPPFKGTSRQPASPRVRTPPAGSRSASRPSSPMASGSLETRVSSSRTS